MAQISNHLKSRLHKYFEIKLQAFDYRHGWMKSRCPFCGKEMKFGINLGLNRTNCFRCGEHPSAVDLVMHLEGLERYTDVVRFLENEQFSGYVFKEEVFELKEIGRAHV